MAALSEKQLAFWQEHGYVVVPSVVPEPLLHGVIATIEEFLGKNIADKNTWYDEPIYPGGIVNMNHHQSMWETRQYPRLHESFSDLFGSEKLLVSVDRTNMNPPAGPKWNHEGTIHWDMDSTEHPIAFGVQGVLCLSDTDAEQGGFQCVPGFHRRLQEWAATQPEDRPPSHPQTANMEIKNIPAAAGDLIIWHRALPHGNSRNGTDRPRLCQYITMSLAPDHHVPRAMPLARAPRAALADLLGVPEGLLEQWMRAQRAADRVRVRALQVGVYEIIPYLVRLDADDGTHYLHQSWAEIVDRHTAELPREHALRLRLPIDASAPGSAEQIRQTMRELPAPRFSPRLTASQLSVLADLVADGPTAQSLQGALWDEHNLATLMEREFDIELETRVAALTSLGRRLAGVDAW